MALWLAIGGKDRLEVEYISIFHERAQFYPCVAILELYEG
jgi:hypothetical protein